jgi:predicted GH43/DUF377 family glycosyl hydrolase
VLQRVLDLTEDQVHSSLLDLDHRFGFRHRALHTTFREHADVVTSRLDGEAETISDERLLLLGAAFTHEYSIEGAALCNPSAVPYPDADADGTATFVMSVRGIGEGHRSSIGFRCGSVTAEGKVTLEPAGPYPTIASSAPAPLRRSVLHAKLAERDDDLENASFMLDPLPDLCDDSELEQRIVALSADIATRRNTESTITNIRAIATSSYRTEFPDDTVLSERVLWPHSPAERHGMEDARFVRFVDDDGSVTYYATYTAFDGANIAQHLLTTHDFTTFHASPLAGAAASGKGLALFPRKVNGRYAALSRSDRESNSVTFSDDMHCWHTSEQIQTPGRPWELLQLGNCGSPIETADGWLVLTHGVGAMRTYALGVLLLDLDDPTQVIASSAQPIITPRPGNQDGYVPNVVYSCGGFAHGDVLVLPYGVADQTIAIATLSIRELVASLTPTR